MEENNSFEMVLICGECDEKMKIIWVEGKDFFTKPALERVEPMTTCWKCPKCEVEKELIS